RGNDRGLISTEFYDESASARAALRKRANETPYAPGADALRDHGVNRSVGIFRRRAISANCCQQELAAKESGGRNGLDSGRRIFHGRGGERQGNSRNADGFE